LRSDQQLKNIGIGVCCQFQKRSHGEKAVILAGKSYLLAQSLETGPEEL
jgi:hypothetical protein